MYTEKIIAETLWTWVFVIMCFVTYFVALLSLSRETYASVKSIIKKFDWIIKGLAFALILALIPGSSWCIENGMQNRDYVQHPIENFLDLPLIIRMPIYFLLGLLIQFLRTFEIKNK